MKKYLSIIAICLIFVCCLFGCKQNESEEKKETASSQITEFETPDDYTTVLLVSINPSFKLYLNENNKVLAVEPVNDDAKSMVSEIEFENKNVNAVVNDIVKSTEKNGFLKEDATVDIKITETRISEVEQTDLITNIEKETKGNFKEVKVVVSIALEDKKPDVEKTKKKESDSDREIADEVQSDVTFTNENTPTTQPSTPTHTHKYSDATCTTPKKCDCGSTNGNALGHDYVEGICSRCKEKDLTFKYPTLSSMKGKWIMKYAMGDYVCVQDYSFGEVVLCGEWQYLLKSAWPESEQGENCSEERCITWNNQHYCREGGGLLIEGGTFSETNDTINIIDDENKKMVLQRTSTNTMRVISVEAGFAYSTIPVNTVMTFETSN